MTRVATGKCGCRLGHMTARILRTTAALVLSLAALASAAGPSRPKSRPHRWPPLPAAAPVPEARASPDQPPVPSEKPKQAAMPRPKPIAPDPRSAARPAERMPAEELACRDRIEALGVVFEEHEAERDAEIGCAVPYPLLVRKLGGSVDLEPDAEMNCAMAEAAARFAADVVSPAAEAGLGSPLKSVTQASAYVCRPRHGGGKMSEHAFGNALDIAGFTLADGTALAVKPGLPERQKKFLDAVRKAACGPFRTVLGPGADADHELHLHLDLEPRRNGGTFCQ